MSAKSFKSNPALQFITTGPPQTQDEENPAPANPEPARPRTPLATSSTAVFDRSPGVETKSKRLNLLIRPSLFTQISNIADQKGLSNNDLIHRVLEQSIASGSIQDI